MKMICILLLLLNVKLLGGDQPQWGERFTRNMVSQETGLADSFDFKTGKNIKWSARLGTETHSTPMVANGRIYIGTNNEEPRDAKHKCDAGVLMCFNEADGKFLWQLVVPKREEDPYLDWPKTGMSSPITADGDRVYTVSNRGEVLCLDPNGMGNGNDGPFKDEAVHMTPKGTNTFELTASDGDIVWLFDMVSQAGIWTHDGAHSSILVDGDFLYLNTGTGVDNTHRKIRTPDAPSIIVLDKKSGRLLARDYEKIAPRIFHATWSSPSKGTFQGKPAIYFNGGDGVCYAFEPIKTAPLDGQVLPLKKLWSFQYDTNAPTENVHRFTSNRREGPSNIYGMPVILKDELYLAGGGDIWWGKNEASIKRLAPGISQEKEVIWTATLSRHVLSTPAVKDNMVFIADCGGSIVCLNRETGATFWTHELGGEIWSSPLIADGKVYLGTRRGDYAILAASPEKKLIFQTHFPHPISGTTTAANKTLYVATMENLYAISADGEGK